MLNLSHTRQNITDRHFISSMSSNECVCCVCVCGGGGGGDV